MACSNSYATYNAPEILQSRGPKRWHRHTFLAALLTASFTVSSLSAAEIPTRIFKSDLHDFKVEVLSSNLDAPWGFTFLPDGSMLITEQYGDLHQFKNGKLSPALKGVPKVRTGGQAGLLDIEIDPKFSNNNHIYLTLTEPGDEGAGISVVRAKFTGSDLKDTQVIFQQNSKSHSPFHFGSRMAFAPDGTLFFTIGDRFIPSTAQDPTDHSGSVLRINKDGTIPSDNPFADDKHALPEIWSIGHRNTQGIDVHPETGEIWTVAHGPTGGDEINQPEAGKNYGWPIISYGLSLSGGKVGVGTHKAGLEQPHYYWDPSIAPSSMTFYDGTLFPKWKGNIFVSALRGRQISRLELKGKHIVAEEQLLQGECGRIRRVKSGPDGALYAITDNGELLKLSPSN